MFIVSLTLLSFVLFDHGVGWSNEPHKIVGKLAASLLSRRAGRFVKYHIKDREPRMKQMTTAEHSLVSISTWADTVGEELVWSRELHFAHTPELDCQPFVFARDCESGRCVVSAIANYTMRASDYSLSRDDRAEAIKFLVHLMADIHNPMHLGFERDAGGNGIQVHLSPDQTDSLHEIWDWRLIESLKRDGENWMELLTRRSPTKESMAEFENLRFEFGKQDPMDYAARLASETSTSITCSYGYQLEDHSWIRSGQNLPASYTERSSEIAWTQLLKSASRLSQLLEAIAMEYYNQEFMSTHASAPRHTQRSANVFASLDLEEYVYELEDPQEIVIDQESEETEFTSTVAPLTKPRGKKSPIVLIKRVGNLVITRQASTLGFQVFVGLSVCWTDMAPVYS